MILFIRSWLEFWFYYDVSRVSHVTISPTNQPEKMGPKEWFPSENTLELTACPLMEKESPLHKYLKTAPPYSNKKFRKFRFLNPVKITHVQEIFWWILMSIILLNRDAAAGEIRCSAQSSFFSCWCAGSFQTPHVFQPKHGRETWTLPFCRIPGVCRSDVMMEIYNATKRGISSRENLFKIRGKGWNHLHERYILLWKEFSRLRHISR